MLKCKKENLMMSYFSILLVSFGLFLLFLTMTTAQNRREVLKSPLNINSAVWDFCSWNSVLATNSIEFKRWNFPKFLGKIHYLGVGPSKLKAFPPVNYFPGFLGKNSKNCPPSKFILIYLNSKNCPPSNLFLFTSLLFYYPPQ